MIPIIAGLVSMLADKGLDLVSSAIDGGADKAKDFIEAKTGIQMDGSDLSDEQIAKLKELEISSKIELEKLAFENKKEDNRASEAVIAEVNKNTADARAMQVAALGQDDKFSKRFVYVFAAGWSIVAVVYIFMITFMNIPTANVRFADTVLGFLLGTIVATIINYFYGSSKSSADKNEVMKGR
jgi:hypothetical protein